MAIRKPFFVIPLDLGTMTSGNALLGYPVFNLNRHKAIGLTWRTSSASNVWARGVFSSAQTVDFASVIAANALPGTQIRLRLGASQTDVDGGSAPYDSGALDFISPSITREDELYHSHLELPSPVSALWWRVDITGHTGVFDASMLVMGKKVEPSRYYDYGFERGIRDLGTLDFSRWGVFDEEDGAIFRTLDLTLSWQTEAEMEASFFPMMEKLGTRGIVHVVFDPEPTPYRQRKTYLGVFGKAPFARGTRKIATYQQDLQIISMI